MPAAMGDDPLERHRKQLEQLRKLTESPLLEMARKQQEQLRKQQEQLRGLAESPLLPWIRANEERIADFLSGPAMDSIIQFQGELADDVIEYASPEIGEDAPLSDDELAQQAELFRYRALQFLIWRLEGLAKIVNAIAVAMLANNQMAEEAVFDPALVLLVMMLVATSQVLLWYAKGPPRDE